jgi:hypothetical protein
LRSVPLGRVLLSLNFNLICSRGINVPVLSDLSQNKFVGIVLDVKFIRLDDRLHHKAFLCHSVILVEPFQLLLVNRPDIYISYLFSVKFEMLLFLAGFIRLVTKHTMDQILFNRVVTVKVSIFIIEI